MSVSRSNSGKLHVQPPAASRDYVQFAWETRGSPGGGVAASAEPSDKEHHRQLLTPATAAASPLASPSGGASPAHSSRTPSKVRNVQLPQSALDAEQHMKSLLRRLTVFFAIALLGLAALTIAASALTAVAMNGTIDDSRLINVGGRQRMLSERIVGTSLAIVYDLDRLAPARGSAAFSSHMTPLATKLSNSLTDWEVARRALLYGNRTLGISRPDTRAVITSQFEAIWPRYEAVVAGAGAVVAALDLPHAGAAYNRSAAVAAIADMRVQQPLFVAGMNSIVNDYDGHALSKVSNALNIIYGTGAATLVLLVLEAVFLFRPALNLIRKTFKDLQELGLLNMRTNAQLALTKETLQETLQARYRGAEEQRADTLQRFAAARAEYEAAISRRAFVPLAADLFAKIAATAENYLRDLDSLHKALKSLQLTSEAGVVAAMRNEIQNKHGAVLQQTRATPEELQAEWAAASRDYKAEKTIIFEGLLQQARTIEPREVLPFFDRVVLCLGPAVEAIRSLVRSQMALPDGTAPPMTPSLSRADSVSQNGASASDNGSGREAGSGAGGASGSSRDLFKHQKEQQVRQHYRSVTRAEVARQFRAFLVAELSIEGRDFCIAVEEYQQHPTYAAASLIVNRFLAADAKEEVNIAGGTRVQLLQAFASLTDAAPPPVALFEPGLEAVYSLLATDPWQRFLRSDFGKRIAKELKLKELQSSRHVAPLMQFFAAAQTFCGRFVKKAVQAGQFEVAAEIWQQGCQLFDSTTPAGATAAAAAPLSLSQHHALVVHIAEECLRLQTLAKRRLWSEAKQLHTELVKKAESTLNQWARELTEAQKHADSLPLALLMLQVILKLETQREALAQLTDAVDKARRQGPAAAELGSLGASTMSLRNSSGGGGGGVGHLSVEHSAAAGARVSAFASRRAARSSVGSVPAAAAAAVPSGHTVVRIRVEAASGVGLGVGVGVGAAATSGAASPPQASPLRSPATTTSQGSPGGGGGGSGSRSSSPVVKQAHSPLPSPLPSPPHTRSDSPVAGGGGTVGLGLGGLSGGSAAAQAPLLPGAPDSKHVALTS